MDNKVNSSDLAADITARHESQEHYGYTTWCAGHRNGASGLDNPNTDDIDSKSISNVFLIKTY